jgi:beta-galactosidase/beta-glucuronidase
MDDLRPKLLLNGHSFFVRGVNYAPTPIGKPGQLDMLGHPDVFLRDLKNLRAMHANAVKTYDYYSDIEHSEFLDAAYNDGQDPIYTVFSIWIDQSLMECSTSIDSDEFQSIVRNYYDMARLTSHHAGIMGYSIGREMNSIVVINEPAFWGKFSLLTQAVHRGLAENGKAKKIITTTFVDDGGMTFTAGERCGANVDLCGSNVYQTDYPGSVIPMHMRVPGGKPLLISEYGSPYASNQGEGSPHQLHTVVKHLTT